MSDKSAIEWTDATWNPVTGCTKVSKGCKNCYAEKFAERWRGIPDHPYEQGFDLRLWPERLNMPYTWKAPRVIFVNSMSDLFHKDVPAQFIKQVFSTMKGTPRHTYQVLTKRAGRLAGMADRLPWPDNVWMGVSVESDKNRDRIEQLREVPARVRFLSIEPLLGPLKDLDFEGIDWVIVGGESGPGARPVNPDWVLDLRDQCLDAGVPFFFKQWGGVHKKKSGRMLEGRTWDEMPTEANGHILSA